MKTDLILVDGQISLSLAKAQFFQGEVVEGKIVTTSKKKLDILLSLVFMHQDEKKARPAEEKGKWEIVISPDQKNKQGQEWNFTLPLGKNFFVTRETDSFFLQLEVPSENKMSKISFAITANALYASLVEVLERFYRFKVKRIYSTPPKDKMLDKAKKLEDAQRLFETGVVYEFKSPEGKDFGNCIDFEILFKQLNEEISLELDMTWKKIEFQGSSMSSKNVKKSHQVAWPMAKILMSGKFFNHEWVQNSWSTLLSEVKEKLI
ncbi:MAG: hypothetical protein QE271_03330 [Bacteriovoracaceae bacterium]|nr:hypothetical protein [Bacteriovoracaceae bacterium]